jgi:uncharacterized protein YcfJ
MRLYVQNKITGQKQYLTEIASSREELAKVIGSPTFTLFNAAYHVNEVLAEPSINTTITGSLIGGIIGSIIEPGFGTLVGGSLGGLFGNRVYQEEVKKVEEFNQTRY